MNGNCNQCYYFNKCVVSMPEVHLYGVWKTIPEKRAWMIGHMMDCFKSHKQHKRDMECAEKSRKSNIVF